jgi:tRNA G10  N-methylase Trm11
MREIDDELEVEAANFEVFVTWKAFVDKKMIYFIFKGKMYRRELIEKHEDFEFDMENRIIDKSFNGDWEIYNRSVVVRSRNSRGRIEKEK